MKKLLLPLAMLAVLAAPAMASAEQCRNAKGQFAKCGTPGAMTSTQYSASKGKPAMKAAPAMKPAPAMAMKPGTTMAMKPAMAPAKAAPCKDSKGKFIKCPPKK